MKKKHYFIFDVESIGLHGEGFAVAGGVWDGEGTCVSEFCYACPPELAKGAQPWEAPEKDEDRKWVTENIPPIECHLTTPQSVRLHFWREWLRAKHEYEGIQMWAECGWPVEANFLRACVADNPAVEKRNGPYPLHEIATMMLAAGMDPMATYSRAEKEEPKHHPMADARQSARLLFDALRILGQKGAAA